MNGLEDMMIDNKSLREIAELGGHFQYMKIHAGFQFRFENINCDFIYHSGSYGSAEGLYEIMPNPETMSDVKGYLTLEEVIASVKIIKEKYERKMKTMEKLK